jgi:Na+-translocating ferredoxin:NAD+ oxidoreductase RnfG subunit
LKTVKTLKLLVITAIITLICSSLYALTTDEIIQLKEHGVSDKTIQLMIQDDTEKSKQAETSIQIKETDTETIYSTGKPDNTLDHQEQQNLDSAWEMLRNMQIEIER